MKRVSVAEARNSLPSLIHEAEREPIEIVRRGKPVAVLISRQDFERMPGRTRFYDALMEWRARYQKELLEDDDAEWISPRAKRPGRPSPQW